MNENYINSLFRRMMKYLNLTHDITSTCEKLYLNNFLVKYTVRFNVKENDIVLCLRSKLSKYNTIPSVTSFIESRVTPSNEKIISEFMKHLICMRFEFIFQRNELPDDLFSKIIKTSFKLPESLEQLEIFLTVSGF